MAGDMSMPVVTAFCNCVNGAADSLKTIFSGLIDEVEIFTSELSQDQVQAIYNAGPAGTCKPGSVPPNNDFANAQLITGAIGTMTGTNFGATKQTGEPNHGNNPGGASVWYKWVAPASGPAWITAMAANALTSAV